MFRNWLVNRNRPTTHSANRARLAIELLEDRAVPTTLVGLTTTNRLVQFDSNNPQVIFATSAPIKGLTVAGEDVVSIDSRPASGVIYGLTNFNNLYALNPTTGVATPTSTPPAAFALVGQGAIDFNPAVDRLRVVTGADQNFRIDPNNGAIVDGDAGQGGVQPDTPLAFAAGDANAGRGAKIRAVAYDRNFQGSTATTLYAIDAFLNILVRIGSVDGTPNSPNGGAMSTIGALGINPNNERVGLEITADGTAYASMIEPDGLTRLYTIQLTGANAGKATRVGKIKSGTLALDDLTSLPRNEIIFGATTGNRLVSFRAHSPSQLLSSVLMQGLIAGETIAGLDFRPGTNLLYGLTSTNRVVVVNTTTAVVTQIGVTGGTFGATAQAGFDFNPAADRLRLVNAANDSARFNPVTNTFVQDDTDLAYIATDSNVGVDPNVVASAYDRNDVNVATATTLFGIDSTLNNLVRQGEVDGNAADVAGGGSPNGGLLTTLGSLGVDPTNLIAFDISDAGTNGQGAALAAMQLNGEVESKLFHINLTAGLTNQPIGRATLIGTVGGGVPLTAMAIATPVIQFTAPIFTVSEGSKMALIRIKRTGSSGGVASFMFTAAPIAPPGPGKAQDGLDFTAGTQLVTFQPGETEKTILVPIINNSKKEPIESVQLSIDTLVGNAILGPLTQALLKIKDND